MATTFTISTEPGELDLEHYSGDTLSLRVNVDAAVVAGREFLAQIRNQATSQKIAASFSITPDATGADVILLGEASEELTVRGEYEGVYDIQLAMPGGLDPVTTILKGKITLIPDVSREVA